MVEPRDEHQPVVEPVEHPELTVAELEGACATTVALVLASCWEATPLTVAFDDPEAPPYVCDGRDGDEWAEPVELPRPLQCYEGEAVLTRAVRTACAAQYAEVHVLLVAPGEHERAARAAVAAAGAEVPVHVLNAQEVEQARCASCNFELMELPWAVLALGHGLLEGAPACTAVALLPCDQPRLAPWHLAQLGERLRACPQVDVVTSWIVWLRRLPVLVTRRFFATVEAQGLCAPVPGGVDRPVPQLLVEEVVFGEEKLQANGCESAAHEAFFANNTLSAREAVRLARALRAKDEGAADELVSLGDADTQLVTAARELLDVLDACVGIPDMAMLKRWDAWARRNERDFPLLQDAAHRGRLAYVDSAATAQRLDCALRTQEEFDLHGNANVYRGSYALSAQATAAYNDARAVIEGHLNAERRQVVFTANTTTACNLAAQAWGLHNLQEGDVVLVALSEHHSNMLPWRLVAAQRGAHVEYLPLKGDGRIDLAAYRALLEQGPKLVAVAQVSNVLGLVNPIKQMAELAHATGARVFVDAAQSFPHLALDVAALGADFVAFSGHKAYGPLGVGCLWIGAAAFEEMDPVMAGGGTISHVGRDSYYLRAGAIQYELGTPPVAQALGLAAAVEHLDVLGMDAIEEHSRVLTDYLVAGLHALEGVTVWGDHTGEDGKTGLVSFNVAGVAPERLATDLGKLQVCIRAGGQCALPLHAAMGLTGTGRISLGVHNTVEDVEAALLAVKVSRALATGTLRGEGA